MRRLLFVTFIVAVVLTLLRHPNKLALAVSVILWSLVIGWETFKILKAHCLRERLASFTFLIVLILYSVLSILPDKDQQLPRLVGNEWPTRAIRMGFEPLTGRQDFNFQSSLVEGNNSRHSNDQGSVLAVSDPNERVNNELEQFENLIESIEQIFGSSNSGMNEVFPANLSGFETWIEFEKKLKNYMWIGQLFMGLFLAYSARMSSLILLLFLPRLTRQFNFQDARPWHIRDRSN